MNLNKTLSQVDREGFFRLLAIGLLGLCSLFLVPEGHITGVAAQKAELKISEPTEQVVAVQTTAGDNAALAAGIDQALEADAFNVQSMNHAYAPYVIETGARPAAASKKPDMAQNFDPEEILREMSTEPVAN